MVSGAGRRLTCRSVAACAARSVTERGSRRYAAARAAATRDRSPAPANVPASAASSASTAARSAALRHAVSRTSRVARHSFSCPVSRAVRVCGISVTRALARPRSRPPLAGDSRRARAICAPTPAPSFSAGTPSRACSRRWSRSKATASRACSADAADFQSSSSRIRSMIPALSVGGQPKPSGPAASRPATSAKAASAVPGMAAASPAAWPKPASPCPAGATSGP